MLTADDAFILILNDRAHAVSYQVEGFGVGAKETVLPGRRHHDVIVLRLERRFENLRQFPLVLDDQDPHLHRNVIDGRWARS